MNDEHNNQEILKIYKMMETNFTKDPNIELFGPLPQPRISLRLDTTNNTIRIKERKTGNEFIFHKPKIKKGE